ncbi:50S ribosomal protein P1, partial [Candidatus Woesearchaeota archaeon CG10_big_fil_rev_8_21_14_0_10_47_5]
VKAVIAAVEGVDIDQVIKESAVAPVAASQTAHPGDKTQEDKKEKKDEGKKKEEDKGSEEAAAAGLGALFG